MPVSTTLPIMAGLSIVGAALGVGLGKSAIAEINPAYFNEPEARFHADQVPYRSPDWAQVHASEYRAAQQPVIVGELGRGCIGCRDYPIAYVPRHDPAVDLDAGGELLRAPEPTPIAASEAPAQDPDLERVQLYASYPVSSDERAVEVAEAPAEEPASPTGL